MSLMTGTSLMMITIMCKYRRSSFLHFNQQLNINHNNLPPFKCSWLAAAGVEMVTVSFPTSTGRRTKSWGISARHRAQRRLRPATPFTHKKQKMCEHGSCTGNTHGCKQTGHSAVHPAAASPGNTETTSHITYISQYDLTTQQFKQMQSNYFTLLVNTVNLAKVYKQCLSQKCHNAGNASSNSFAAKYSSSQLFLLLSLERFTDLKQFKTFLS